MVYVQLSSFCDYFRWYKVDEKDAMGQKNVHRGFSDPNLFVAQVIIVYAYYCEVYGAGLFYFKLAVVYASCIKVVCFIAFIKKGN